MCSEDLEETLHFCTESPFQKAMLGGAIQPQVFLEWDLSSSCEHDGSSSSPPFVWPSLNYVLTFFERRSLLEEQILSPHGIRQSKGLLLFHHPSCFFPLSKERYHLALWLKISLVVSVLNTLPSYTVFDLWLILFYYLFSSPIHEVCLWITCVNVIKSNNWWILL